VLGYLQLLRLPRLRCAERRTAVGADELSARGVHQVRAELATPADAGHARRVGADARGYLGVPEDAPGRRTAVERLAVVARRARAQEPSGGRPIDWPVVDSNRFPF